MSMELNERFNEAITEYIRPAAFPLAVKLSKSTDLPSRAKRPLRDLGCRLNVCQGTALARTYGWTIGFLREDHACGNSIVIFGMEPEPNLIKDGSIVYPLYTETLEAGAITQKATPAMPVGEVGAIWIAPLHRAEFEPDVVLIYGQPGQIIRLVQADLYENGGVLTTTMMGRAACAAEIVTPIRTGKCNVVLPGGGEKAFGGLPDDQAIFSVPSGRMEAIIKGLEGTHKAGGNRYPWTVYGIRCNPRFPSVYKNLEDLMGIPGEE